MKRLFIAFLLVIFAGAAAAQGSYPNKPLHLIVGYAPGGPTDIVARLVAAKMQESMGQPVIVENKPGAGSNIASEYVVKSAPDGYTLLVGSIANATNMVVYKHLSYDTLRDLAPITQLMSAPSVLVVTPGFPAKSLQELIALAKRNPGKYAFASTGSGGSPHLAGEMLKMRAGIDLIHVPYKGAAPVQADLIGGQVQMAFETALSVVPHVQSGQLRAIAVASNKRLAQLPDVPTMAEAGLPDFEVSSWNGLFAPAKTPPEIIARLHEAAVKALAAPDVREKFTAQGAEAVGSTPEDFHAYIRAEIEKWGKVVRASGARVD
jgi:tripartite-type tricarboxylate transporter receptor subunit TctC